MHPHGWTRGLENPRSKLEILSASHFLWPAALQACDVFATAAADIDGGTIKLWDVRSQASVRRFSGHRNGSYPVGVAFSPCMRFVAAGSEDSTAYIFDLRQGAVLHRLQGAFMDVVSDVDFHPHRPILAASCLSGAVRYFGC